MMVLPDGNPIVPDHHLRMTTEQHKALARDVWIAAASTEGRPQ